MMEKGILFLARLKSSDYKKRAGCYGDTRCLGGYLFGQEPDQTLPGDGYWAENGGTWACYPTYGKSAAARQ